MKQCEVLVHLLFYWKIKSQLDSILIWLLKLVSNRPGQVHYWFRRINEPWTRYIRIAAKVDGISFVDLADAEAFAGDAGWCWEYCCRPNTQPILAWDEIRDGSVNFLWYPPLIELLTAEDFKPKRILIRVEPSTFRIYAASRQKTLGWFFCDSLKQNSVWE